MHYTNHGSKSQITALFFIKNNILQAVLKGLNAGRESYEK